MPLRSLASHIREAATTLGDPVQGRFTSQSMRNAVRGTRKRLSAHSIDDWLSPEDDLVASIKTDPHAAYVALLSNWCKITGQCLCTHYEVRALHVKPRRDQECSLRGEAWRWICAAYLHTGWPWHSAGATRKRAGAFSWRCVACRARGNPDCTKPSVRVGTHCMDYHRPIASGG